MGGKKMSNETIKFKERIANISRTDLEDETLYWYLKAKQAQTKIERYEKALREIANEQEVGEGDFNADDVANNLIATAKEALEGGT
jgi:hypothetical protein